MAVIDHYDEGNKSTALTLYATSYEKFAQAFTGDGNTLGSVTFHLAKVGAPTGSAFAKVYAHSGTFGSSSKPTGAALATAETLDVATVPGVDTLIEFPFSGANRIVLESGTRYVVAFEYEGAGDASNYVAGSIDADAPSHPGNLAYVFAGGAWAEVASWDAVFYVHSAPLSPAVRPDFSRFPKHKLAAVA